MGILANFLAATIFFLLMVAAGILAFWILSEDQGWLSLIFAALAVLCLWGFIYGTTHRVVPPNERWVIKNTIKGEIDGTVRQSGIIKIPFVSAILKFPGAMEQPFCIMYYPALQEGYEIAAEICATYDASQVDWVALYTRFNIRNEEELISYWANQSKEQVSLAFQTVNYAMLATERYEVSNKIRANLQDWYDSFGIVVKNIAFTNWDFTSTEVKLQVDKASVASIQKTVESQLLEAAKISRERKLYEVNTANLVLQERSAGFEELLTSMGLEDDNAKAFIAAQMAWLAYAENPPTGVQLVLSLGGGSLPVSIPIAIEEAPPVTTETIE